MAACKTVVQYFEFLPIDSRFDRVCGIVEFLNQTHGKNYKMIIFVKSKVMADHLSSDFCMKGINSQGLHGGRSQADRELSLKMLRSGEVQILVATDLASRGIDVPDITTGEAMSFMGWSDRSNFEGLISILEKSGQQVPDQLRRDAARYRQKCQEGRDGPRPNFRNKKRTRVSSLLINCYM